MKKRQVAEKIISLYPSRSEGQWEFVKKGGSDRLFFRVKVADMSLILMDGSMNPQEFRLYYKIGKYLHKCGTYVPEIFAVHMKRFLLVMEDLGNSSLYEILLGEKSTQGWISLYKKTLELLARIHAACKNAGNLLESAYDYEHMRWETWYFKKHFLEGKCGLKPVDTGSLEDEFDMLARNLENIPPVFMHRDFQSQNILFKNRIHAYAIDFQSAKRGPAAYDLASILKDSYAVIPPELQEELLGYYCSYLGSLTQSAPDEAALKQNFHVFGLQRNMQALGAFSRLSMEKGKKEFEAYIPCGLSQLISGLKIVGGFHNLKDILEKSEVRKIYQEYLKKPESKVAIFPGTINN